MMPKIVIDILKAPRQYVKFSTKYGDTFGRCYTMTPTEDLLGLGVTKITFISYIGVNIFLEHPGQHLHVNSRAKVYSDVGKKHFIDVLFDLSINTWTQSKDIPCNPSMNVKFDDVLYQNLSHALVTEFNCTVPFLPDLNFTQEKQNGKEDDESGVDICHDPQMQKASYKRYKLLKRNKENALCENPCNTMQIFFGLLFTEDKARSDRAFIKIYLQSMTRVKLTVMDYDSVTMIAEIGGYTGLLLGMSVINFSTFMFKSIFKLINRSRNRNNKDIKENLV